MTNPDHVTPIRDLPFVALKRSIASAVSQAPTRGKMWRVYALPVRMRRQLVPGLVYVGITSTSPEERRRQHDKSYLVGRKGGGFPFKSSLYRARPGAVIHEVSKICGPIRGKVAALEIEKLVSEFFIQHGYLVAGDGSSTPKKVIRARLQTYLVTSPDFSGSVET